MLLQEEQERDVTATKANELFADNRNSKAAAHKRGGNPILAAEVKNTLSNMAVCKRQSSQSRRDCIRDAIST